MKIEELFRQLSLGELSNLAISADGTGAIKPEKQDTVILHTQTALDKLYGRFLLLEKTLVLTPLGEQKRYPLLAKFSTFGRDDDETADPFIIDTEYDPFTEDVIRVTGAEDSVGRTIFINDDAAAFSLFTPSPAVVVFPKEIPSWLKLMSVTLTYQAKHPKLLPSDLEQEFELPTVLELALRSHIAGEIYGNMNGEANTAKGLEFMTKFELECQTVIDRDLVSQSGAANNSRFRNNGWV